MIIFSNRFFEIFSKFLKILDSTEKRIAHQMTAISEKIFGPTPTQNEYASSSGQSLRLLAVTAKEVQEKSDLFDVLKTFKTKKVKNKSKFTTLSDDEKYEGNDTVQGYLSLVLSKNEFEVKELSFLMQKIGCRWRAEILNVLQMVLLKPVLPDESKVKFRHGAP